MDATCERRDCQKDRSRSASTVWYLRRDLEAARCGIEELEEEITRLEDAFLPPLDLRAVGVVVR